MPSLESCPVFIAFDEDASEALVPYPSVRNRALTTIRFAWYVSQESRELHCHEDETVAIREGFLRAALAEFVGMEEMVKRVVPVGVQPHRIHDSKKPLLHILRELRNHELHLRSSPMSSATRNVLFRFGIRPEDPPKEFELTIWFVEGVTVTSFKALRNACRYSNDDIVRLVEWFNAAQRKWGVNHLIWLAVHDYAREVISRCQSK